MSLSRMLIPGSERQFRRAVARQRSVSFPSSLVSLLGLKHSKGVPCKSRMAGGNLRGSEDCKHMHAGHLCTRGIRLKMPCYNRGRLVTQAPTDRSQRTLPHTNNTCLAFRPQTCKVFFAAGCWFRLLCLPCLSKGTGGAQARQISRSCEEAPWCLTPLSEPLGGSLPAVARGTSAALPFWQPRCATSKAALRQPAERQTKTSR